MSVKIIDARALGEVETHARAYTFYIKNSAFVQPAQKTPSPHGQILWKLTKKNFKKTLDSPGARVYNKRVLRDKERKTPGPKAPPEKRKEN